MHVGVSFSFEAMFNNSSVNLDIGVDGGLYTNTIQIVYLYSPR